MGPKTFEEATRRLETATERLDEGDLSLNEAMEVFAEAMQCHAFCRSILEQPRQRIDVLQRDEEMGLRLEDLEDGFSDKM